MNHLKRFSQTVTFLTAASILIPGFVALTLNLVAIDMFGLDPVLAFAAAGAVFILVAILTGIWLAKLSLRPVENVWQAIWHVSPEKSDVPAPKVDSIKFGRELISAMVLQIYDFASKSGTVSSTTAPVSKAASAGSLIEQLPLAVFVLDKDLAVTTTNSTARRYLGLPEEKIAGQKIYDVLRMSFQTDDTFENWLMTASASRATDTHSWEHVKAVVEDKQEIKQFDLAASYSRDESAGNEVILALFDRTAHYGREESASSYVTMAVHELRTPVTVLRGYIEVFEDELGPGLSPEYQEFMRKMSAAAQSLSAFVSNILNVARVDENQLTLQLHEANWNEALPQIISDLELRASVRGKTLELDIEPGLPTVGIDRISMYEVVSNLVDNAIKYSGQANRIVIHSRKADDNTVETVVEDFGPGMPESILPQLFTKFYRSHRSRGTVGGSGLGLYLVKSIVTAHGGSVWVNSKEGEGSKFGFTVQTFASMNKDSHGADGIERHANGWIKNHSMYRR